MIQGALNEKIITEDEHTRIPVYKDNIDHIVGFIHSKDLAKFLIANNINLKVMNSNCKTAFILAKENDLLDIAVLISHTLSLQNNK